MSPPALLTCELRADQFTIISEMVYRICGITLRPGKENLVKARLIKRLYVLGLDNFEDYLAYIEGDSSGKELTIMIDVLTTNKTSFFRESQHFTYLQQQIASGNRQTRNQVRFWSAGCASGEEPYSLAIVLREAIPDIDRKDIRILATDISTRILATARQAVYEKDMLSDVPEHLLQKYFRLIRQDPSPAYQVTDNVRTMVRLARLNLMQDWPMRGPFEAIFCRNVMIYFDEAQQHRLVARLTDRLQPGGYLFLGHSEHQAWITDHVVPQIRHSTT